MLILEGQDIDVLSPFPPSQWATAARWLHGHKTLVWGDGAPETPEASASWLADRSVLPGIETYAVVDRENLTRQETPSPLVGFIFFEPQGAENAYAHVAAARRAWGQRLTHPGMIEQASELVIQHVFASHPRLQRLSVAVFANNYPAQHLAKRMGFRRDGYFRAMASYRGQPMDVVHFGRLREDRKAVETEREALAEVA